MVQLVVSLRRYLWVPVAGALLIGASGAIKLQFAAAASTRHSSSSAVFHRGALRVEPTSWVAAWTGSPEAATPGTSSAKGLQNQTVRNVLFTSAGGRMARVRFANTFGTRPVVIARAALGVVRSGAAIPDGKNVPLTFSGRHSVVVPPGGEASSDPVHLPVRPLEELAVSIFLPRATGPLTQHTHAHQVNYLAAGNHTLDTSSAAFTRRTPSWYFVTGLDVLRSSRDVGTVVALGDSITDGVGSQTDANARWPNYLARRLDVLPGATLSAVDAGIGGNRVLNGSECCGVSALARFSRDVLSQPAVSEVIVLEGINDINYSSFTGALTAPHTDVSAGQIIAGYEQLIARTHAAGRKIFGATLTPFEGAQHWTPAGEAKRETVNRWILTSRAFDGAIDFAAAVAEPGDPEVLNPAYDSGDHLHPNDAGYRAMAQAVTPAMLLAAAGR